MHLLAAALIYAVYPYAAPTPAIAYTHGSPTDYQTEHGSLRSIDTQSTSQYYDTRAILHSGVVGDALLHREIISAVLLPRRAGSGARNAPLIRFLISAVGRLHSQ